MNLKELQDFIFDFNRVSLAEMKLYLQIDGNTLRPMLDRLVQKGKVQRSPETEECQTCHKCQPDELEFYEWIDSV